MRIIDAVVTIVSLGALVLSVALMTSGYSKYLAATQEMLRCARDRDAARHERVIAPLRVTGPFSDVRLLRLVLRGDLGEFGGDCERLRQKARGGFGRQMPGLLVAVLLVPLMVGYAALR
jgi:hypothetical protein